MSLPKLLLLCVLSGSFVPLPCRAQVSEIYPSRVPLISGECGGRSEAHRGRDFRRCGQFGAETHRCCRS